MEKKDINEEIIRLKSHMKLFNIYLTLNFAQLAVDNSVNKTNTGGYVVEVFKQSGEKVRFSLDGFDNTEATVLIGPEQEAANMTFDIYRYDPYKR